MKNHITAAVRAHEQAAVIHAQSRRSVRAARKDVVVAVARLRGTAWADSTSTTLAEAVKVFDQAETALDQAREAQTKARKAERRALEDLHQLASQAAA